MIRIELEKGLGTQYHIRKTAYNFRLLRIMDIYIDNTIVPRDQYQMEGPRAVRLKTPVEYPHRVFASINTLKRGNRYFS